MADQQEEGAVQAEGQQQTASQQAGPSASQPQAEGQQPAPGKKRRGHGVLKALAGIVLAVVLVCGGFALCRYVDSLGEPKVSLDAVTVSEQLENCQELATAKLEYRGLVTYEEGEIDWLTKTGFTMVYDATVRAGVDLSEAEVKVEGSEITISLPAATIQTVEVDADSLEFYDEKYALFNWQDRDDTATALELAEEDALEVAEEDGLVEAAEEQAVETIETLFAPFTADDVYTLTVTIED